MPFLERQVAFYFLNVISKRITKTNFLKFAPLKSTRVTRDNLPWIDNKQRKIFDNRDKIPAVLMSYNDKSHPLWNNYRE